MPFFQLLCMFKIFQNEKLEKIFKNFWMSLTGLLRKNMWITHEFFKAKVSQSDSMIEDFKIVIIL